MFGIFFHDDLVMKIFLQPFFFFPWFKKSSCQLMAKECTLSTGKLPPGGLSWNSVVRLTDHPDMTSAVYRGHKALNQTNQKIITIVVKGSEFCCLLSEV